MTSSDKEGPGAPSSAAPEARPEKAPAKEPRPIPVGRAEVITGGAGAPRGRDAKA